MHIIYSLDSPLVLVTWPNSCAEKRGKPDTGEKHKRYRMCVHAQSCLTLCNSRDCGPPGSSVHGIFQARILESAAISISHAFFFPGGSDGKESACKAGVAGDPSSIPGSGRSPGGGHGNPLQSSCLQNPMNRGAWWATAHKVAESDTTAAT